MQIFIRWIVCIGIQDEHGNKADNWSHCERERKRLKWRKTNYVHLHLYKMRKLDQSKIHIAKWMLAHTLFSLHCCCVLIWLNRGHEARFFFTSFACLFVCLFVYFLVIHSFHFNPFHRVFVCLCMRLRRYNFNFSHYTQHPNGELCVIAFALRIKNMLSIQNSIFIRFYSLNRFANQ